jgi:AhpD family alkylhydroperoxidase
MESRIEFGKVNPDALAAMYALEAYVQGSGIEPSLIGLVKVRASQLNGCAFCIDMHTKEARSRGESEQRLYLLDAWREAQFYTERERAALEWTEALTLISKNHVPDDVFERVRRQLSETELVDLSMALVAINGWNRLCIAFRAVPGSNPVPSSRHASVDA